MGKIVKFCSKCDESFASKFSFCPNCAESLEAFEMNPVNGNKTEEVTSAQKEVVTEKIELQKPAVVSSVSQDLKTKNLTASYAADDILELDVEGNGSAGKIEMPSNDNGFQTASLDGEIETVVSKPAAKDKKSIHLGKAKPIVPVNIEKYADTPDFAYDYQTFTSSGAAVRENENFHITVLQEKNVKERNFLLFGATALMLTLVFGGFLYSLFAKNLDLAAVDSDSYGVIVPDVDEPPMTVEEKIKPKDDSKSGGGGGGNNDPKPLSKGQYATHMDNPIIAPTVTLEKRKTEVQYQAGVNSGVKIEQTDEKYGNPNGTSFDFSDGPGSGGGQGTGMNRGQGDGEGSGLGSGKGGGTGGTGTGPGGDRERKVDPPKKEVNNENAGGVSSPFKLLSKPKPSYTDDARKNNIKGTVRVRVQFLANGQIGSVTPINSLGYGLTEKAIAAARSIRFEPPKKNGQPYAVTKVIDFNFTIY